MKKIIEKIKNNKVKAIFYFIAILFLFLLFLGIILSHGNLMKNYLFANETNTFMDFFNSMYDTIGLRPYEKGVIYPPLCYLIYYVLILFSTPGQLSVENGMQLKMLQGPMVSFMLYSIIIVLGFIFLTLKMKKGSNKEKYIFITLMMLSIPFLFAFERGNIILVSFIFLLVFMCFKDSENKFLKEISLISLAASTAIKIYPAIFVLILIKEKRWFDIFRVITYGLILFVLPFLFFCGYNDIIIYMKNFFLTLNIFPKGFELNNISFLNAIYNLFPILLVYWGNNANSILTIFIILLSISSIFVIFKSNSNWKTLALIVLLMIGLFKESYQYISIFMIIPFIYFIDNNEKRNILDYIYLLFFILILLPIPLYLFEKNNSIVSLNSVPLTIKMMSINSLFFILLLNFENLIKNKKLFRNDQNNRLNYIDVTKGLALFLVILGHLVKIESYTFKWIFSFHMPLFFILSGMCCNFSKYKTFKQFFKRKFKTLIKPYFLFSLIGFIICLLIPSWRDTLFSFETIKQVLYDAQPELLHVGQIWFLVALFFSNIIFYIFENKILKKANKFIKLVIYILLAIIGYKICDWIKIPYFERLPWRIDSAITATIFLAIGYYIKKINLIEILATSKNNILIMFWLLFINILFGIYLNNYVNICNCFYSNIYYYYISSVFGSLFLCMLGYKLRNIKLFGYYGKNSLSMFAMHSMLLYLAANILSIIYNQKYMIMNNIPLNLCILSAVIIYLLLFPISCAYNFCKKIKISRKKRKVKNDIDKKLQKNI